MNWMILTKMLRGASLGTTNREPLGNKLTTMLCRRLAVVVLLSHFIRIMYTLQYNITTATLAAAAYSIQHEADNCQLQQQTAASIYWWFSSIVVGCRTRDRKIAGSTTSLLAGVKVGHVHLCWVAGVISYGK